MFLIQKKSHSIQQVQVVIHIQHLVERASKLNNRSSKFNVKTVHVRSILLGTLIHYDGAWRRFQVLLYHKKNLAKVIYLEDGLER